MKRYLILFLLFYLVIPLSAQSLTLPTNAPRHSDVLCKVEIPDVEVGERGEEVMWQLSEITDDSRDHLQAINSNGDTIATPTSSYL